MGKKQISIRIPPEILKKIDEMAASETRTRNNMIEVLVFEALHVRLSKLNDRLDEQMDQLTDKNLEGEALDEEIRRASALTGAKRGRPPKKKG